MLKRHFAAGCAVLALAFVVTSALHAQSPAPLRFGIGGGVTNPTGDFKTGFGTGWNALATVGYQPHSMPLGVRLDGMYQQDNAKSPADGKAKLAGGNADLEYQVGRGMPFTLYALAGVGVFDVKSELTGVASSSETKFAWNGGVGANFGVGPARLFVESRYISIATTGGRTKLIPVSAGVTFHAL